MSYKFAQLRRGQLEETETNNPFLNEMTYELQDIITQSTSSMSISFIDKIIILSDKELQSTGKDGVNKSYYLKIKIKQKKDLQNISIKLINSTNKMIQNIDNIEIDSGNNYSSFDFIISPNSNYNQIKFELNRTLEDYQGESRVIDIEIESLAEVKNLITDVLNPSIGATGRLKQIGVQGKPGMLMCINGEAIRIGRSGLYEINNGIDIIFINFIVTKNDNQYFLLDYQY